MKTKVKAKKIGMRELGRNLSRISHEAAMGNRFLVTKNNKTIFRIEPENEIKKKIFTSADLTRASVATGDPNLSQKVDEIVYGT